MRARQPAPYARRVPDPAALPSAPPLGRWQHTWRLLLILFITVVASYTLLQWQYDHARWWLALDLTLGLASFVAVHFRRRWPVAVALVLNAATLVSSTAAGPATLALASLATRRRWREIVPVSVVALLAGVTLSMVNPTAESDTQAEVATLWGLSILLIGATVGWGSYIGSRRELIAELSERADSAERNQAARAAQAKATERTRIAREMHDVLAHRISLVTMHADAMVHRTDMDADQLRASAEVIRTSSRQALMELREVLGVLRDDPGDAAPETPQPGADDIELLVAEATAAGMRVAAELSLDLAAVPDSAGRTLYRTAQEALTNARKHAPGALVTLELHGAPADGITLVATNPAGFARPGAPPPASGLGLVGLSERVTLAGGRMAHRSTASGGHELEVWLPWSP